MSRKHRGSKKPKDNEERSPKSSDKKGNVPPSNSEDSNPESGGSAQEKKEVDSRNEVNRPEHSEESFVEFDVSDSAIDAFLEKNMLDMLDETIAPEELSDSESTPENPQSQEVEAEESHDDTASIDERPAEVEQEARKQPDTAAQAPASEDEKTLTGAEKHETHESKPDENWAEQDQETQSQDIAPDSEQILDEPPQSEAQQAEETDFDETPSNVPEENLSEPFEAEEPDESQPPEFYTDAQAPPSDVNETLTSLEEQDTYKSKSNDHGNQQEQEAPDRDFAQNSEQISDQEPKSSDQESVKTDFDDVPNDEFEENLPAPFETEDMEDTETSELDTTVQELLIRSESRTDDLPPRQQDEIGPLSEPETDLSQEMHERQKTQESDDDDDHIPERDSTSEERQVENSEEPPLQEKAPSTEAEGTEQVETTGFDTTVGQLLNKSESYADELRSYDEEEQNQAQTDGEPEWDDEQDVLENHTREYENKQNPEQESVSETLGLEQAPEIEGKDDTVDDEMTSTEVKQAYHAEEPVEFGDSHQKVASEQITDEETTQENEEKQNILGEAVTYYNEQNYEDTIVALKRLLRRDPEFEDAYRMLGVACFKNDMIKEAIEVHNQLKELSPNDTRVYENLGSMYASSGYLDLAISEWKSLLELAPYRTDIRDRLRHLLPIQSQQNLGERPNDKPEDKASILGDALQFYHKRDYDAAADLLQQWIKEYPDSKDGYKYLGSIYFRSNRLNQALRMYEQAAQIDDHDIHVHESLAILHSKLGNDEKAVDILKRIPMLNHG